MSHEELHGRFEARALTALPPMRLVFIDTETTGLARHWVEPEGRVIEFCALPVDIVLDKTDKLGFVTPSLVRLCDQKVHFKLKLTEEDLKSTDPTALQVNGYLKDTRPFHGTTETDLSTINGKNTRVLWQQAAKAMRGRIVCSQNVMFDLQFVEKELRLYELSDQIRCWERKYVELWTLSTLVGIANMNSFNKNLVQSWERNSITSLSLAVDSLNLANSSQNAHTANGDVELGFQLFEHYMNMAVDDVCNGQFKFSTMPAP